jgi:hypothetical protein
MNRVRKFLRLSWSDKWLLIQTLFLLAFTTVGLRLFPWLSLQKFLLKLARWYSLFKISRVPSVIRIGWAVHAASRSIPNATCLPQALVAQYLFVRDGYPVNLQIGVAKGKNEKLQAHAWVTSDNQIIFGKIRDFDDYVPLAHIEGQTIEDYAKAF